MRVVKERGWDSLGGKIASGSGWRAKEEGQERAWGSRNILVDIYLSRVGYAFRCSVIVLSFFYPHPVMPPCAIFPSSALPTYFFLNWHFQLRISTSVSLRPNFLAYSMFFRFSYSVSCRLYARKPWVQIYPGGALTMLVEQCRWGSAATWATNA